MESKQLKYLCREQDSEVSTFCLVFSSLRPYTRCTLLSTKLLQLDSWTNIFQGSIINCADTKTHWTGWISFHLFAHWQNVTFFFCSSSMKLLSIFPTALLQITVCPAIQKQEGFTARSWLICELPCSAPRQWDTGCSSLGVGTKKNFPPYNLAGGRISSPKRLKQNIFFLITMQEVK